MLLSTSILYRNGSQRRGITIEMFSCDETHIEKFDHGPVTMAQKRNIHWTLTYRVQQFSVIDLCLCIHCSLALSLGCKFAL
jgi:hypothetical protein